MEARLSQSSATCSPPRQPPSARLVLERTPCYGDCPDYKLEIHGNGRVIYEGRTFVRVHGPVFGRIPRPAVDALFARAACAHPEKWRSEYTWPVTDNPTANVTVDLAGDGSPPIVVRDYPPCHETHDGNETPAALCELEKAIDDAFGIAGYVECTAPNGARISCRP